MTLPENPKDNQKNRLPRNDAEWAQYREEQKKKSPEQRQKELIEANKNSEEVWQKIKKSDPEKYHRIVGNISPQFLLEKLHNTDPNQDPTAYKAYWEQLSNRLDERIRIASKKIPSTLEQPVTKFFRLAKALHLDGKELDEECKNAWKSVTFKILAFLGVYFHDLSGISKALIAYNEKTQCDYSRIELRKHLGFVHEEGSITRQIGSIYPFIPAPDWESTPTQIARNWISAWMRDIGLSEGQGRRKKHPDDAKETRINKFLGLNIEFPKTEKS